VFVPQAKFSLKPDISFNVLGNVGEFFAKAVALTNNFVVFDL